MVPIASGVHPLAEGNMTRRNWRALALAAALMPSARDVTRRDGRYLIPIRQDGGDAAIEAVDESEHRPQERIGTASM